MRRLSVSLPGGRDYPIVISAGGIEGLGAAFRERSAATRACIVTNPVVGALYLDGAVESLAGVGCSTICLEIPDGESHKTIETWLALVESMLAAGVDRKTPVIALGGGVTGDVVGFAAASVMRGVPLFQVPTTLLAMVDSSVGGKTAVNSARGKNLIGAFYQPELVFAPLQTLQTLDVAELRCGLGEVIKHGLLEDVEIIRLCRDQVPEILGLDGAVMGELVERCCAVKAAVVVADERERGLRAVLNLGHTVGHAIEQALGYGAMRHGECVAIGLVAEARWAVARGDCAPGAVVELLAVIEGLGLSSRPPAGLDAAQLVAAAQADKKLSRGTLTTAILEEVGRARLERVPASEISAMMAQLLEM
ncbi:MAG: 3-dehydroquinate synthase [Myxococcota bacterium]|jgi:3-dehydroquinate synthase